jgi:hypothetical protein
MALNRDKLRKIVGGITTTETPESPETPAADIETLAAAAQPTTMAPAAGEGRAPAHASSIAGTDGEDHRRFAKRGRPKGRRDEEPAAKTRKVKVSLFLSEVLVNDLYDWAHHDRIHPGEMFERALKPFHEKEAKRRNAGKE